MEGRGGNGGERGEMDGGRGEGEIKRRKRTR